MKILLSLILVLSSGVAHAADRTLTCNSTMGGKADVTLILMPVEAHPNLFLVDLKLTGGIRSNNDQGTAPGEVQLEGLLAGAIGPDGGVLIQGQVEASEKSPTILNPESITLQGRADSMGAIGDLTLLDQHRELQGGFGLYLNCR